MARCSSCKRGLVTRCSSCRNSCSESECSSCRDCCLVARLVMLYRRVKAIFTSDGEVGSQTLSCVAFTLSRKCYDRKYLIE